MPSVHLVYQSYLEDVWKFIGLNSEEDEVKTKVSVHGGLGGGGSFGEPTLLKAFSTKVKARMWIAKNRTKFTPEWKYEWTIKTLEVS
jgi:hypothetical protein